MRPRLEQIVTVALAAAAIAVAMAAIDQIAGGGNDSVLSRPRVLQDEDWERALSLGIHVAGSPTAPVKVVALMDLQCPACRGFHEVALELTSDDPRRVEILYGHYPLSYHPQALAAARIAECALAESASAFVDWISTVFQNQSQLRDEPWRPFAKEAGLPADVDPVACAGDAGMDWRIEAGLDLGESIGLQGTPTVIVNGMVYPAPPSLEEMRSFVNAALEGDTRD